MVSDKRDCFGFINKNSNGCGVLEEKKCLHCVFYRPRTQVDKKTKALIELQKKELGVEDGNN